MLNKMSDYVFVSSTGEEIPIIITTRRGVRNITLRPKTAPRHEIHISKPWISSDKSAMQKQTIAPGDVIDLLGRTVTIHHDSTRRANKFIVHDDVHATLVVGGGDDVFESRVRNFVKTEFLKTAREMIKTAPRELWPTRVVAHDTTTRWGSCSTTGTMSLSWRLAFAPVDVMRYVVMHELAHRRHMDHSPAFWATVSELYGFGVERAKRWLNQHGGELHKYF